jgi:uncharacterized RDD family membrane protein YckC
MEQPYNQNNADLFVDEPVIYAGFWERFGAVFLDGIILSVVGVIIGFMLPAERGAFFTVANLLSLIINWLYYTLQESGAMQATIGKKALGLKVTSVTGGRITFAQATVRYFGRILSTLILLIGYLMMLWDDKKQTLHDKLAGTLVTKVNR